MKNIPVAAKIVFNIVFFALYSFIGIFIGSFLYGLVMTILNKSIAGPNDSIHLKIALISALVILLISGLFRKYFYFPVCIKKTEETKKKSKKTYSKKIKQEKKEEESDEKMKIYIDKEIK